MRRSSARERAGTAGRGARYSRIHPIFSEFSVQSGVFWGIPAGSRPLRAMAAAPPPAQLHLRSCVVCSAPDATLCPECYDWALLPGARSPLAARGAGRGAGQRAGADALRALAREALLLLQSRRAAAQRAMAEEAVEEGGRGGGGGGGGSPFCGRDARA